MTSASVGSAVTSRKDFSSAQLKLIRRSVARACNDSEFDEFIAVAAQSGLDPLRRQIAPLILNGNDPDRRRLVPWATIDGLRVIAARQGDYRPMEVAPLLERNEMLVDPERNPLGIARAEVRAWKYSDGVWHAVAGEAWWDEYAPLSEERATDEQGRLAPTGRLLLDPGWKRMGRVMISKCAEAQALRRGWPDVLSGLYGEEELHALKQGEQTASERLQARQKEADKLRMTGSNALWLIFDPDRGLESVPREDVASRVRAHYLAATSATEIEAFQARNQQSLNIFWDWAPADAMELKLLADAIAQQPSGRRAQPGAQKSPRQGAKTSRGRRGRR
jgi:phage recombination protein Bet